MGLAGYLLVGLVSAVAPPGSEFKIDIADRPRPVLGVIDQLRQRHGWPITYEDDSMSGVVSYPFAFSYQPSDPKLQPSRVLSMLVDSHARLGQGQFKLEKTNFVWHIVPAFGSALDAKITIPDQTTPLKRAMEIICSAVERATGKRVVAGRIRANGAKLVRVRGNNETARAVLTRVVAESDPRLNWDLIYSDELDGFIVTSGLALRITGGPMPIAPQ